MAEDTHDENLFPVSALAYISTEIINYPEKNEKKSKEYQEQLNEDSVNSLSESSKDRSKVLPIAKDIHITSSEVTYKGLLDLIDLNGVPSYKVSVLSNDWNKPDFGLTLEDTKELKLEISQDTNDIQTVVKSWLTKSEQRTSRKIVQQLLKNASQLQELASFLQAGKISEAQYQRDFSQLIGLLLYIQKNPSNEYSEGLSSIEDALALLLSKEYYHIIPTCNFRNRISEVFCVFCNTTKRFKSMPKISRRMLEILDGTSSLNNICPANTCLYLMISLALMLNGEKSNYGKLSTNDSEQIMLFFSKTCQKSNNKKVALCSVVGLCSILPLSLSLPSAVSAIAIASDMVSSPDLMLHDPTNRIDIGIIMYATYKLAIVASEMDGPALICKSGCIRRIIKLLNWCILTQDVKDMNTAFNIVSSSAYGLEDMKNPLHYMLVYAVWILFRCSLASINKREQTNSLWNDMFLAVTEAISWARDSYEQIVQESENESNKNDDDDDLMAKLEREKLEKAAEDNAPEKTDEEIEQEIQEALKERQRKFWLYFIVETCGLSVANALLSLNAVSMNNSKVLTATMLNILKLEKCLTSQARSIGARAFVSALQQSKKDSENIHQFKEISQAIKAVILVDLFNKSKQDSEERLNLSRAIMILFYHHPTLANKEIMESFVCTLACVDSKSIDEICSLSGIMWGLARSCRNKRIVLGKYNICQILSSTLARVLDSMPQFDGLKSSKTRITMLYIVQAIWELVSEEENASHLVDKNYTKFLLEVATKFSTDFADFSVMCLKLLQVVCIHQKCAARLAKPYIMDLLFKMACKGRLPCNIDEECHIHRLATSLLIAIPFPTDVAEPCYVALAKDFIFTSYRENHLAWMYQQIFGSRLLSRLEFSSAGQELLRRSGTIEKLVQFILEKDDHLQCHKLDEIRRSNALIAIAYCSLDKKTQRYLSHNCLYQLLSFAWTTEVKQEQELVSAILNNINSNKCNRTRIFKAEMRARNIVTQWVKSEDAYKNISECNDVKSNDIESLSIEESQASIEFDKAISFAFQSKNWKETPAEANERKKAKNRKRQQLPSLKKTTEETSFACSILMKFREKILSPQNNMSPVIKSNSAIVKPYYKPNDLLHHMRQPAKLLWYKRSFSKDRPNMYDENQPWSQPLQVDPLYELCKTVPMIEATNDLEPPGCPIEIDQDLNNMLPERVDQHIVQEVCGEEIWKAIFEGFCPRKIVSAMIVTDQQPITVKDDSLPLWFQLRDLSTLPMP